ncbi:hypothetical protein NliqN6_5008 [Naganishia liquefaciens]|uniref:Vacuolar membrane protein n=1 Tax=Naganishia liquefaciens TaxID=104408 RepID=A0A8H3TW01_9TREE|nr:hypothetical protein NliqN6_5008 [Naganishia liquefaciens]
MRHATRKNMVCTWAHPQRHAMQDPPPDHDPEPDHDPHKSCSLVGPVALIVQALMAVLVVGSLLVKRWYEGTGGRKKRRWRVWALDVGKQLIGQGAVHGSNLLISDQVADKGGSNPCSLYFLNVLVDTTIGVLVLYLALKGLTKACILVWGSEGFISGVFGHPPRIRFWLQQLGIYLGALLVMKLFVLVLFALALDDVLLPLAGWILNWMAAWSQVVFVMAIFPLLMNIIQFCLIDSLIKGREDAMPQDGHAYTPAPTQPKDLEEALLDDSIDPEPDSSLTQSRFPTTFPSHQRGDSLNTIDGERGRGRSRDASRTSSRARGDHVDGLRTPRTASTTGVPRQRTPVVATSPLLGPIPVSPGPSNRSLGMNHLYDAEGMRRTKSTDGYGSTGSTAPSPVPRADRIRDQDVSPLPGLGNTGDRDNDDDDDDDVDGPFPDLDITPRPADVSRIPGPSMIFPSRIDERVRIQARRSLSSEEPRRKGGRGTQGSRDGAGLGHVVMLDDV